jgi:hypothetical protein
MLTLTIVAFSLTILLIATMNGTSRAEPTADLGVQSAHPLQDCKKIAYRTFWSGELRIFALTDNVTVTMIDIATGLSLSFEDKRIDRTNFPGNPFVLSERGDSFEGIGGIGGIEDEIQVRIESCVDQPILVWTGSLSGDLRYYDHTYFLPLLAHHGRTTGWESTASTSNAWMSYLQAIPDPSEPFTVSRKVGRELLGFASREMYLFARKNPSTPTRIVITDLETNTDNDTDDSQTLDPTVTTALEYSDDEIEIYYLDGFEDDTVNVTSNVDLSVLVGYASRKVDDWAVTPPSYGAGDGGIEKGREFYTFVSEHLTIFPLEDDTQVTVTNLSHGDRASETFTLINGAVDGTEYDFYTPKLRADCTWDEVGWELPDDEKHITPTLEMIARPEEPRVNITTETGGPFDDDYVKVEADKDILVYVGPPSCDINEFADFAPTNQVGDTFLTYVYAQNGGDSNDLQVFGLDDTTVVTITSLSKTDNFRTRNPSSPYSLFHDFVIGPGIGKSSTVKKTDGISVTKQLWLRGTAGLDVWWGTDRWRGELLRIEATKRVIVLNGDYDSPNFGTYVPFLFPEPTITIKKQADPADDTRFDFTFDGEAFSLKDGESKTFGDLRPDTYTVTETVPDGWALSRIHCDNGIDLTSPDASQVTIDLQAGEDVVCTFENVPHNSITIIKQADPADGTRFDFTFADQAFRLRSSEAKTFVELAHGAYPVTETVPAGWVLSRIHCDNGIDLTSPDPPQVTIDLQPDQHVTCTFENTKALTPRIRIEKIVENDPAASGTSFEFTFDGESFSLKHGEAFTKSDLLPGTYSVIETVPGCWLLREITCDATAWVTSTNGVSITLQTGEQAVCTFTNQYCTAVELVSFTAEAGADSVTLAWETASEIDSEGFNLWRSEAADGAYTKINPRLIPAQGDADSGASYEYIDTEVIPGVTYYYKLEDVDLHGVGTFHGPVSATVAPARGGSLKFLFAGIVVSGAVLRQRKKGRF